MRTAKAVYVWLAASATGIVANIGLHRYRLSLYDRNSDYPQFHPLQRIQYELFWATVAVMALGSLWVAWLKFRKR